MPNRQLDAWTFTLADNGCWSWRCAPDTGETVRSEPFTTLKDCYADAQRKGYTGRCDSTEDGPGRDAWV